MRKLLWSGRIWMIALLFIVSNTQQTSAQKPGQERASEPVSETGSFGDRSGKANPTSGEEKIKPGVGFSAADARLRLKNEVGRIKRLRRDPSIKVIKAERPEVSKVGTPPEEVSGGLELAREPVSAVGNFGEKAEVGQTESGEEETKPGVILSSDSDRPLSGEKPRRIKRLRRDPNVRVIKEQRP